MLESFTIWFPRLAQLYDLVQLRLRVQDNLVNHFFMNSPFAAQSLNVSPQSLAKSHTDQMNLVYGVCGIIPMGNFNGRTGAQLILNQARAIIELHPGDVFFFPSACIHHRSAALASKAETRQCMVVYSAAGLFRWIRQGHMGQKYGPTIPDAQKAREGAERWHNGWKLFSHIDEFRRKEGRTA